MTAQSYRLPAGSAPASERIDRSKPLRFIFNGRAYHGYQGDTLASALLANGVVLVGRSFKYHRPRGILTAGAEEPNALVQLGVGARTEPNLRATQVELFDGLTASSVNCWPSVEFDLGGANHALSRLFPAGFYYKTFMWPAAFWKKLYEPIIRRAAGFGRVPREPDPDRYDKTHAHCDVLVVGGGPAGLAAALAAGRAGARVILADEQAEFGGSLLGGRATIDGGPAADWIADTVTELRAMPEVRLLPRATVFGYYDHNYLTILERVSDHLSDRAGQPRQRLWKLRAKQVVLATGAIERPLVFADNDRPGIMLAAAGRTYVNRYGVAPGRRAVLFTNNDDAYRAALDLAQAGVAVAAVVDLRNDPDGPLPAEARERGIRVIGGHAIVGTTGFRRVASVKVAPLDSTGERIGGPVQTLACDLVLNSGGWNPAVHLFSQSRGKLRYNADLSAFVPDLSAQQERSAGAAKGSYSLAACLADGFEAGVAAAAKAGFEASAGRAPEAAPEPEEMPAKPVWLVPGEKPVGQGAKHFVDYQNDVTAGDVLLASREGYRSVEHLKRYTTTGMGTDQGKTSNVNALAILAASLDQEIATVGTTTFRPPYTPVTIGAFAGHDQDDLLEPVRRTPMHSWHENVGAPFENVGQWRRAWYYPRPGEAMRDAVNREAKAVRTGIGIADVSTLGKIDIQGPDAVTLLNRVYTNGWSTLEIGRCRYGLMLGEDGMVFDDGVTTRLGEQHYLMSTTSGNAARVLGWLEEWLQCEWTDLKVYCTGVTEQWATVAINGPMSRRLLGELTQDIDLDPRAFPFMSMREGHVAGIPARVFRISFTGELSFEVNVPGSYGLALWQALMTAGEKYRITPYGTETMHVLRAEKGYIIVGQETDGTQTPGDLGMDWIVSRKKGDFIGRRSLARSDTARGDRKHLVGLLTGNPSEVIPEGSQIVAELKDKPPMIMIGHVTSSYYSPNVGRSIAMAVVKNGRNRMGETVFIPLEDRVIRATVTEPRFFDPEGKRIDG